MGTSKKTRLNRSPSQQTEPFAIWTENSVVLHRKTQNWTVRHRNREVCLVSSKTIGRIVPHINKDFALFHRKRQNWTVLHSNRLNRFPSEQRIRCCYIENNKTESFPIATEKSALLPRKRQDWIVACINKELCSVSSRKISLNRSPSQQTESFPM